MAADQSFLRINSIYASGYQLPDAASSEAVKSIGPTWGSWRTWQSCATDNVICHELTRARELFQRSLQTQCNLYLPQKFYQPLQRPGGIQFYQGDFQLETIDLEDIVAMHLVSAASDVVLLFGFDLSKPTPTGDRYWLHQMTNRLGLIRQCVVSCAQIQWVLVDHAENLDLAFQNLPNLTCDKFDNVLHLLS